MSCVNKYSTPWVNTLWKHLWQWIQLRVFLGMCTSAFLLPSSHSHIKPWFVKCCRDCCPSSRLSHFSQGTLFLSEWSLGSWSPPWPRSFLPSLVGRPAIRRVWVVPHSSHFLKMDLTVLLGTFNTLRNCFIPFPRSMPPHNSILEFYLEFLGLHGGVSALTCTVNCGALYRKVFLSQSWPINWIGHRWTPMKLLRYLKDDQRK